MTWAVVRAEWIRLLGDLSVTVTDGPLAIRTVFEFPPDGVDPGNLPCVLIIPPSRVQEWGPNQSIISRYTARAQFLCRSDQAADRWEITEAFADAAMDVIVPALRMNQVDDDLQIVHGPSPIEPQDMEYGGQHYTGFEMTYEFQFSRYMQGFAP